MLNNFNSFGYKEYLVYFCNRYLNNLNIIFNMNKASEKDFEKNNKIVSVKLNKFSKVEYNNLLKSSDDLKERQVNAQKLVDYLCDKFGISPTKVSVLNVAQPHSTNERGSLKTVKFGDYNTGSSNIRVWNLTAARKQTVSIKRFADTLLHEFIHHYDINCLKFQQSPHTSGFYKRLGDLSEKLK